MQNILSECRLDGNLLFLPNVRIPSDQYQKVKIAIIGIGGVWNTRCQAFYFDADPSLLLERVINGERINLDAAFKKKTQYFSTTPEVFDEMYEYIQVSNDMRVLEPSAGEGFICDSLHVQFPLSRFDWKLDVCELYSPFQEKLRGKGYNIVGENFLTIDRPQRGYHLVVANLPLSNGQDVLHFRKMYSVLAPGGRIVKVMSNSWRKSVDRESASLREWRGYYYHSIVDLSPGSFKRSGTNIGACLLIVDKPFDEEY